MGRYDFRASRVLKTSTRLVEHGRLADEPLWASTVRVNTPPQILVRNQPVQHSGYSKQKPGRKARGIFRPQTISYPEDSMRSTFFAHHPWELARPRIVQEGIRADRREVWDSVRPRGLGLQPENVIRRQLHLIEQEGKDPQTAYDIARREFYKQRMREDIERKVAKEEAMHVGAYFGKSTIAWGMELEDRKFYGFKQWAGKQIAATENARQAMVFGVTGSDPEAVEEMIQNQALIEEQEEGAADT